MMQDQNKCVMTLERPGIIYWGKMLLVFEKKKKKITVGGEEKKARKQGESRYSALSRSRTQPAFVSALHFQMSEIESDRSLTCLLELGK